MAAVAWCVGASLSLLQFRTTWPVTEELLLELSQLVLATRHIAA